MNVFEEAEIHKKKVQEAYDELPAIEETIARESRLILQSLRSGNSQEFFEHSKARAIAESKREEIVSIPCNGSGVPAEEVEIAWAAHQKARTYRKALEDLFKARESYRKSIRELKDAFKHERYMVEKFRNLAATSGCRAEIISEMIPPRNLRWDLIEKVHDRGQFVNGIWQVESGEINKPEDLEG